MDTSKPAVPITAEQTPYIGRTFNLGNYSARCVADALTNGGAFSLFEIVAEPGIAMPPHMHQNEDETYYVIEGALAVMQNGKIEILTADQCLFAGRGLVHAWQSVGETAARVMLMVSPGGFERFFHELEAVLGEYGAEMGGSVDRSPELLARARAVMADFGMTLSAPEKI